MVGVEWSEVERRASERRTTVKESGAMGSRKEKNGEMEREGKVSVFDSSLFRYSIASPSPFVG